MAYKGFISYAQGDREIAGQVKDELADYGINGFLAHEDLEPTVQWQEEITKHLKACDLFIPLISERFRESKWTDQEVGMAVAWKKKMVPLLLDKTTSYGFISKYQATKIDVANLQTRLLSIITKLGDDKKFGATITDGLIMAFADSASFDEAGRRANAILRKNGALTRDQLNSIVEASVNNNQISYGWDAKAAINEIIKDHPNIDAKLVKRFRQATGEIEFD